MIVNRNELKRIRSRRNSQYKQNPNVFSEIQIEQFHTKAKNNYTNKTPLAQHNISNNILAYQSRNYSNITNLKQEGFIRSNRSSICEKQSSKETKQKKLSRVVQNKKMSLDVNLSNKGLQLFIVQLPNGISFRQIYSLNLSGNQIKEILPTYLIQFEFLKQFNLRGNKLQKISFPYNKMQLRKLLIQQNSLTNLNLEHLKYLDNLDASDNRLIFVTLPESVKKLNVENNQLSNTYFLQKCIKIQQINMSYNFIYDLNFNSFNNVLDCSSILRKSKKTPKYYYLNSIQCGHNKISHLNGFYNIKQIKQLNIEFNDLSLSRQNLNEIFQLQELQKLNITQNHLQGPYSIQTSFQFLFDKLTKLQLLNNQQKNFYIFKKQIIEQNQTINNQSSIRANEDQKLINSQQKPFRLFLDQQNQNNQKNKLQTNKKIKKQKQFTLGDTFSPQQQYSQIYKIMTLDQNQNTQKNNENLICTKNGQSRKHKYSNHLIQSQRIYYLQKQISRKTTKLQIPYQTVDFNQHISFDKHLDSETKRILNLIFQMSFYPPSPLSHKNLSISKRIDQDHDEFIIFSKLFQKNCGIVYLRKFYHLQQYDIIFQSQFDDQQIVSKTYKKLYSLGFINCDNIEILFKQLIKKGCSIEEIMNINPNLLNRKKIQHGISPIPSSFHSYHIAIRYLAKSNQAFQKRSFAPVYYLIQSKKI